MRPRGGRTGGRTGGQEDERPLRESRGRTLARRSGLGALLLIAAGCAPPSSSGDSVPESAAATASPIAGAWEALEYGLASGPVHEVRGRIFFSETDWTVLFFVVDAEGEVRRGSGEGGTYTLTGNDLVFTHLYNLSRGEQMEGLPEADLRMTALTDGGAEEPTGIEVDGDRLTLRFPSGNWMAFRKRP